MLLKVLHDHFLMMTAFGIIFHKKSFVQPRKLAVFFYMLFQETWLIKAINLVTGDNIWYFFQTMFSTIMT